MTRNWIKWFRFPSTFLFLLSNKLSESGPASEWIGWMLLLDTLFPNEVSECLDLHNNLIRLFPLSPLPPSPFLLFKIIQTDQKCKSPPPHLLTSFVWLLFYWFPFRFTFTSALTFTFDCYFKMDISSSSINIDINLELIYWPFELMSCDNLIDFVRIWKPN